MIPVEAKSMSLASCRMMFREAAVSISSPASSASKVSLEAIFSRSSCVLDAESYSPLDHCVTLLPYPIPVTTFKRQARMVLDKGRDPGKGGQEEKTLMLVSASVAYP